MISAEAAKARLRPDEESITLEKISRSETEIPCLSRPYGNCQYNLHSPAFKNTPLFVPAQ